MSVPPAGRLKRTKERKRSMKWKPIIACAACMFASFLSALAIRSVNSILPIVFCIAFALMCLSILAVFWGEIRDWESELERMDYMEQKRFGR